MAIPNPPKTHTPPAPSKPLSDFHPIGQNIFLHTPQTHTPNSSLILLCTWMAAAPKHIAKYTLTYQRLFPSAQILLIRSDIPDVLRSQSTSQKLLAPALEVLRSHVSSGGEILLQSFSNGGALRVVQLGKLWRELESNTDGRVLPMRAQIMDSSPGKGSWERSHAAIYLSLPSNFFNRIFGWLMVHLWILCVFLWDKATGRENLFVVMGRELNDEKLFNVQAPRVYLYSRADMMVGFEEVEEHADEAEAKGWCVERVCFEGSPHAGHIREDEGKYWDAVMAAWKKGAR